MLLIPIPNRAANDDLQSDDRATIWQPTSPFGGIDAALQDTNEGGVRNGQSRGQAVAGASIRLLFVVVAFLLVADFHSSYIAAHAKWETNPFIAALAEYVGLRPALVGCKLLDFVLLAVMYLSWRRWRADVAVSIVLLSAAMAYVPIVVDNYRG